MLASAGGGAFDVEDAINKFLADGSRTTLELPTSLTAEQRKHAKKLAEQHPEIRCESYGFGAERRLHLFREPRQADTEVGAGEARGDSSINTEMRVEEIQQAVRVKNTFIDDWVGEDGSSEPVQFRSLPSSILQKTLERCLQEVGNGKLTLVGKLSEGQIVDMDGGASTECPQSPQSLATPLSTPLAAAISQQSADSLPAGLTVQNTFLHIETMPVVNRMVKSMPDGLFQKCLSQELQVMQDQSACPESVLPSLPTACGPETEVPEDTSTEPNQLQAAIRDMVDAQDAPEEICLKQCCNGVVELPGKQSESDGQLGSKEAISTAIAIDDINSIDDVHTKIALLEAELDRYRKLMENDAAKSSRAVPKGKRPTELTTLLDSEPPSPPVQAQTPVRMETPLATSPPPSKAGNHGILATAVACDGRGSSSSSSSAFAPQVVIGTRVHVTGLTKLPDFNGLAGTLQSIDEELGRCNVVLDLPTGARGCRVVKVKAENLIVAGALAAVPTSSEHHAPATPAHQVPATSPALHVPAPSQAHHVPTASPSRHMPASPARHVPASPAHAPASNAHVQASPAHSSLTRQGLSSAPPPQRVAPEMRSSLAYQGLASVPPSSPLPKHAARSQGSKQARNPVALKLNEIV